MDWHKAHADLPKTGKKGHLRHINIEMNRILLESFYINTEIEYEDDDIFTPDTVQRLIDEMK